MVRMRRRRRRQQLLKMIILWGEAKEKLRVVGYTARSFLRCCTNYYKWLLFTGCYRRTYRQDCPCVSHPLVPGFREYHVQHSSLAE